MMEKSSSEDEGDDVPGQNGGPPGRGGPSAGNRANRNAGQSGPGTRLDVPGGNQQQKSPSQVSVDGQGKSASAAPGTPRQGGDAGQHASAARPTSPGSDEGDAADAHLTEAELAEKHEREEEERKRRIQLYVFVLRAVAYPFNAKQSADMQRRHHKVSRELHDKMKAKVEVRRGMMIRGC